MREVGGNRQDPRLVTVERVTGEGWGEQQQERSRTCDRKQRPHGRRERGRGAACERKRHGDLHDQRVAGAGRRGVDDAASAEEHEQEREEQQVCERLAQRLTDQAAHQQSEDRGTGACEEAEVEERTERDVVPRQRRARAEHRMR